MAVILVDIEDSFDQWRIKTNNISVGVGDFKYLNSGDSNVVRAANRNFTNIGNLYSLNTTLKTSIVDALNEVDAQSDTNNASIGILGDLDTSDKSSLVNAINEVDGDIGDLPSLTTDAKTNIIVAVNEVDAHSDTNNTSIGVIGDLTNGATLVEGIEYNLSEIDDILTTLGDTGNYPYGVIVEDNLVSMKSDMDVIDTRVGSDVLDTTASYITGAINELSAYNSFIGNLGLLTTDDQGTLVGAINEVDSHTDVNTVNIGNLLTLETGVKTDLVSAINEVATNTIVMALILG